MEVFVRHLTTSLGYLMVDNHVLCQEVKLVSGNRRVQKADTRMQTADINGSLLFCHRLGDFFWCKKRRCFFIFYHEKTEFLNEIIRQLYPIVSLSLINFVLVGFLTLVERC